MQEIEVAIIGSGTAGLTARREVARYTSNYLVFDPGPYGTTCARVGCMPSKGLIEVAHAMQKEAWATSLGFRQQGLSPVEGTRILEWVRRQRDFFVSKTLEPWALWKTKLIQEKVKLISPHEIQTESGQKYRFQKVIIACGSQPYKNLGIDFKEVPVYTTDEIFEMTHWPHHMAVIGTGVIGLELGGAFAQLGVNVTFFQASPSPVGFFKDPDLQEVSDRFWRQHYSIQTLHDRIDWASYDCILIAAGRRSRVADLGIESLGLSLNNQYSINYDPSTLQVQGYPHIYIAGDATGDHMILHEAADEGRLAGRNAVLDIQTLERRIPLNIVFTHPQMVRVGRSLTESPDPLWVGSVDWSKQGRARLAGCTVGMTRLYADRRGVLVGGEMFAPQAEHLGHLVATWVSQSMTVKQILKLPFYHPVLEEGLRTALQDLHNKMTLR